MEREDTYGKTVDRLEPDIAMIDAGAGWTSIAISLKRIADVLVWIQAQAETEINRAAETEKAPRP